MLPRSQIWSSIASAMLVKVQSYLWQTNIDTIWTRLFCSSSTKSYKYSQSVTHENTTDANSSWLYSFTFLSFLMAADPLGDFHYDSGRKKKEARFPPPFPTTHRMCMMLWVVSVCLSFFFFLHLCVLPVSAFRGSASAGEAKFSCGVILIDVQRH